MLTIKTEPTMEDFLAFNVVMPSGAMLLNVRRRRRAVKPVHRAKVQLNGIEFEVARPPVGRFEKLAALYASRVGQEISPFEDGSAEALN